jgi:sterol desaturase/sphingolipid hydroxylase (fatty acid hydroxylase superfamily)
MAAAHVASQPAPRLTQHLKNLGANLMIWLDTFLREIAAVFPIVISIEVGRYLITAGLVSLIVWAFWNAYFKGRKIQTRVADAADYRREILTSVRTTLVFAVTGFGTYLAAKAGWLTVYQDFALRGWSYFAVTLLAMIVAHDAYFYWTHRAMHHPRLFRLFHRTHHKSKTPTPWTAYAFDVPEAMVMVAFVPLWVAVVPMHDVAVFTFVTWQIVRNVMGHAGVELSPVSGQRSRLFGWLNTTTHHDLHHQDARTNYGLYFSWWDRLMGTEHPAYQARVAEIAKRGREGVAAPMKEAA